MIHGNIATVGRKRGRLDRTRRFSTLEQNCLILRQPVKYLTSYLRIHLSASFFEVTRHQQLLPFFLGSLFLPFFMTPFFPGWDSSKWVLVYALVVLSALLSSCSHFFIPHLTRVQRWLLFSMICILCIDYFYHNVSLYNKETMERLAFWSLFVCYFSSLKFIDFLEKKYLYIPLFISTGLFIICAFSNFIFIKPFLSFTFGNLNKSAEFVGFSLALQLGLYSQFEGKLKKFLLLLISISLAYLYFTKCRSASLGVIFVLGYLLWTQNLSLRAFLHILLGASFFTFFFEFIFFELGSFPTDMSLKWGSTLERWQLLLNTLDLIRDAPLGIGLGRYEFAAAPYMKNLPRGAFDENYSIFSPYNEPLRFLAEEGVITCFAMFLFFASFIFPLQKLKKISLKCPEALAFFIFFGFQFLLQYPLGQPFPFFMVPFVLAYTARYALDLKPTVFLSRSWIKLCLATYLFLSMILMIVTLYISANNIHNIRLNKVLYSFYPDTHILKNILFISYVNKDYKTTKEYAIKELKREPQNLPALKYLGLSLLCEGDYKRGCTYLKTYNAAYAPPSSVWQAIKKYCR